jgi:hypothetical protein
MKRTTFEVPVLKRTDLGLPPIVLNRSSRVSLYHQISQRTAEAIRCGEVNRGSVAIHSDDGEASRCVSEHGAYSL